MTRVSNSFGLALILCASVSFAADAPAPAQTAPETSLERDIQIARTLTEATRQATVAANVPLDDAQAAAFWPIYREYRTEVAKQNDRLAQLIKTYAQAYSSMTNEEAKKLSNTYLDIDQKRLDLKKKYIKKFEKALPAALVTRAMQTEQKLDSMQQFTLARSVPLVPPAAN
jgi:hypothetical protein